MKTLQNEKGFVLVTGLLILVILTLIGIAATRNTTIELQIAGNDKLIKEVFYEAEADDILGTEVLEQNFACPTGFTKDGTTPTDPDDNQTDITDYADIQNTVRVYNRRMDRTVAGSATNNLAMWRNANFVPANFSPANATNPSWYIGNVDEADVVYPIQNIARGIDTSHLYISGSIRMLPGGALQMAAGYEGKGKGAGAGGVGKIMDIYSGAKGAINTKAFVLQGWRHLVGTEGDCLY